MGSLSAPAYTGTLKEAREAFERDYVAAALEQHRGRMTEVARTLGLQRTNLYRKLRQLSLTRMLIAGTVVVAAIHNLRLSTPPDPR